jgi:hypothetical protein
MEDSQKDERLFVKKIAEMASIKPVFLALTIEDYLNFTNNYFENLGFFWEEKTRTLINKKKINLLFSGWGGDEFLSVSESGISLDLLMRFNWHLFLKRNSIIHPRLFLRNFLHNILYPSFGCLGCAVQKSIKNEMKYFKNEYLKNNSNNLKLVYKYRSRKERQLGFIYNYHVAERCERWAIHGFLQGIVYRYPLIDKRIIEYVLQVPSKFLFRKKHTRIIMRDLSKNLLPEEVRWNESKLDYSLFQKNTELLRKLGVVLIDQFEDWKTNPDLNLIDFEILERDIKAFKKEPDNEKWEFLQRNIIFIKMLHEFTKTYRSLPDSNQP